jgi:putative MATE family efflux protein
MKSMEKSVLFEQMPVPQAARRLMVPTILSSLVMVIYSMADTYFVGRLNNPIENSAVTLAAPVLLAFNAVNNLFGVGSSSMMSRALGEQDFDKVKKSSAFGFYCALFCGIIMSLLCTAFFQPLLHLLGADAETVTATAAYMKWTVLFGAAPSILNVVIAYLVRAEGSALHASIGTMSGCILNMILDPVFIMPWGLGMGAAGAGCATFVSNCTACLYFFVMLYVKRKSTYVSIMPKDFKWKKEIVRGVCGVGIPASIQNLLNVTGMTILNNFTAVYGPDAVAAIGIVQKIYLVPMQISMGASQGVMPLVGYSYSAKNYKRMKETVLFIAKVMVPLMVVSSIFCFFRAEWLVGLFMKKTEIVYYGQMFLRADALAMTFLAVDFLAVGVFQAIGMGKKSLLFAILRKIVFEIPALIVLNILFGVYGIAYAAFAAEFMLALCAVFMLRRIFGRLEADA